MSSNAVIAGTEHERIVASLRHGDVVYDVFAGVGPFSLPALRRGATVVANDLNPAAHRWLVHNAALNRVDGDRFTAHCLDGRRFLRDVVRPDMLRRRRQEPERDRAIVLMNLPAVALEFLDALRGLLVMPDRVAPTATVTTVHCYCFTGCVRRGEGGRGVT